MIIALLISSAVSHSWVGCTDYRGAVDYYNDSACYGYPRYWQTSRQGSLTPTADGYQLGADTGYNYIEGNTCNLPMASPWQNAYTTGYPYAVYETGQIYCLAWPQKNHAAATCTNQYIPDTQMSLYMSPVNPTSDPSAQSDFSANPVTTNFGTHTNGVIDCLGFQRAPRFCDNTDRALATGCMSIPSNLATGHYVFQWYWIFNPGAPYVTCWDALVVAPGSSQSRGGGGLVGYKTVQDNLQSGSTDTCTTNWAAADTAAAMVIPEIGSSGSGSGVAPTTPPASPTNVPTTPSPTLPAVDDTTTDLVSFLENSAAIPIAANSTFPINIQYFATARRSITVDILNTNTNPPTWYGKNQTYVEATTSLTSVTLTVLVYDNLPAGSGYLLRAWIVNDTIFEMWIACTSSTPPPGCTSTELQPWTQELDRADFPVVAQGAVATYTTTQASGSGTCDSSKMYTAGDIAATFFGTLLGLLVIFGVGLGVVYHYVLRPQMGTK